MQSVCSVILAEGTAGAGKPGSHPVLWEMLFRPVFSWVAESVARAGISQGCMVAPPSAAGVRELLPAGHELEIMEREAGVGQALLAARGCLERRGGEDVLVLCADAPLLTPEEIRRSYEQHRWEGNAVTLLSPEGGGDGGYGRAVRRTYQVQAAREGQDDAPRTVRSVTPGLYWFRTAFLLDFLGQLTRLDEEEAYYLSQVAEKAVAQGEKAGTCRVGASSGLRVKSRGDLARATEAARAEILERHRKNGVDIPVGDGILIGPEVVIGADTRILPGTILKGRTIIGEDCEIGPNSHLDNAIVGEGCVILSSYIDSSTLEAGVKLGPMSNIRPDCHVGRGAKIGDFVELKNSTVGAGTSVAHLTYVGDSDVGEGCNFGCGVVTVNYDGTNKHRTRIGNRVFVGCNTNLVAPVSMGDGSYSAAGTTVTEDVPPDSLVVGRARQVVKEGWVKEKGYFRK